MSPWGFRSTLRGASVTFLGRLTAGAAAGIGSIVVGREIGPSHQGALVIFLSLSSLILSLNSLGTNVVARRLLASPDEPVALGAYLGLASALTLVQAVSAAGLTLVLLPLAKVTPDLSISALNGLYAGAILATIFGLDALYAFARFHAAALIDAGGSLLQLSGVIVFGFLHWLSVRSVLAIYGASFGAEVVGCIVALGLAGRRPRLHYDRATWKLLIRRGLPGTAANLAQNGAYRLDRYILGILRNPASVGIYSMAASGSEVLRLGAYALGAPIFYRVATKSVDGVVVKRYRVGLIVLIAVAAVVAVALAPAVVPIVLGNRYLGSVRPFQILVLAEIATASYIFDLLVLEASGRIGQAAICAAGGLAIVSAADVLLIPSYGADGAAMASLIGYAAMAIGARHFANRLLATRDRYA